MTVSGWDVGFRALWGCLQVGEGLGLPDVTGFWGSRFTVQEEFG